MPPLRPPADVDMAGQSGGGSDGRWTSDATVRSDMPVAGLEGHFAEQLARAGWVRTGGGAGDGVAWSGWRVPAEEPWRAVLLVISPFESAHRLLSLRLEREADGDGDGGGGAIRLVTA